MERELGGGHGEKQNSSSCIEKFREREGQEEEDSMRHLNIVKNKLTGWHRIVHGTFDYNTARYEA